MRLPKLKINHIHFLQLDHATATIKQLTDTLNKLEQTSRAELVLQRERYIVETAQLRSSAQVLAARLAQAGGRTQPAAPALADANEENRKVSRLDTWSG